MVRSAVATRLEVEQKISELEDILSGLQEQISVSQARGEISDFMVPTEEGKDKRGEKGKKESKAPKEPQPPKEEETPLSVATKKEEKSDDRLQKLMAGYISDILPDYDEIVRSGETSSFCMPPSAKESLVKRMQTNVAKKIDDIEARREKGMPYVKQEADLLMSLYILAEDMKRMPVCKTKELEEMFTMVKEKYPDQVNMTWDAMLDAIAATPTVQTEKQRVKARKELEDEIEELTEEILEREGKKIKGTDEEKEVIARSMAIEEVMKEAVLQGRSQFLSKWHGALSKRLQGYLYNGVKGQEGEQMPSPCGLRIDMNGLEAISKAEDLLTFFGSKDDWVKFYVEGEEAVESEPSKEGSGTFHRMHKKDWPGCIEDVFAKQKIITSASLKDTVDKVNAMKGLDIDVDDFVDDDNLPKGYGYE